MRLLPVTAWLLVLICAACLWAWSPPAYAQSNYTPIWNTQGSYVPPTPPARVITYTTYSYRPGPQMSSYSSSSPAPPSWGSKPSTSSYQPPQSSGPEHPSEPGCKAGNANECYRYGRWDIDGRREVKGCHAIRKACDLGNRDGCAWAGVCDEEGWTSGKQKNVPGAIASYDKACRLGHDVACGLLSNLVWFQEPPHPDRHRVPGWLQRACDAKLGDACALLGALVEGGHGVPTSAPKALALYQRSCDLGTTSGCAGLGRILTFGAPGVPIDRPRARPALLSACKQRSSEACGDLALVLRTTAKTADGALEAVQEGCERRHDGLVCRGLALAYEQEEGLGRDVFMAQYYFDKACFNKDGFSCSRAAWLRETGALGYVNMAEARRYWESGCFAEHPWSCHRWGMAEVDEAERVGSTVPLTQAASVALGKACKLGYLRGCLDLVAVAARAQEDRMSRHHVYWGSERACELGHAQACAWVGWCFDHGVGPDPDPVAARVWYRRACDAGIVDACG
jgi:TPR repeat protein